MSKDFINFEQLVKPEDILTNSTQWALSMERLDDGEQSEKKKI